MMRRTGRHKLIHTSILIFVWSIIHVYLAKSPNAETTGTTNSPALLNPPPKQEKIMPPESKPAQEKEEQVGGCLQKMKASCYAAA